MGKGSGSCDRPAILVEPGPQPRLPARRRCRAAFEYTDPVTGLRATAPEVTQARADPGWLIHGEIVDSAGRHAGDYERFITVHDGQLVAVHKEFELDDSWRGRGFGSRFAGHVERQYRGMGVSAIRLQAVGVGAYVWARAGYRLNVPAKDPVSRQAAQAKVCARMAAMRHDSMLELVADGQVAGDDMQTFLSKFAEDHHLTDPAQLAGMFTEPADIALYGRERSWIDEHGRPMWLGKAFLIDSAWHGIRRL